MTDQSTDDGTVAALFEQDRIDGMERRSFLKLLTASFATLGLPGCDFRPPRERVVPYMTHPDGVVSGRARWYATTCGACPARCGVLAKTLDGRPIKLEGLPEHPLSQGGLCARGQAWILELYDTHRAGGPRSEGQAISWKDLDARVNQGLEAARAKGRSVRVLMDGAVSPTRNRLAADLCKLVPGSRIVRHLGVGHHALREAHARAYGRPLVPSYRFERARVVVGVEADFLGTWLSPVEFTRAWAAGRHLRTDPITMSWHAQLEAHMSLTGTNADLRLAVAPSRHRAVVAALVRRVANLAGLRVDPRVPADRLDASVPGAALDEVARRLAEARGSALVVCGSEDVGTQVLVVYLNHLLDAVGRTVDLTHASLQAEAEGDEVDRLIDEASAGQVGVLIVDGVNPVFDHPRGAELKAALSKVDLTVSLSGRPDETSALCHLFAPDHHPLESWGDASAHVGHYSLFQPLLAPLHDTRSALESLATWAGTPMSAHDLVRRQWRESVFAAQHEIHDFEVFWEKCVHDGGLVVDESLSVRSFDATCLAQAALGATEPEVSGRLELVTPPSLALYDGRHSHNPWLQELPDPVTKLTWGNAALISPGSARELGVVDGRVVRLEADGVGVEVPVLIVRGIPDGVVSLCRGYGRTVDNPIPANKPVRKMFAIDELEPTGGNAALLARAGRVNVKVLDRMEVLARTQRWDTLSDPVDPRERDIVREVTLASLAQPAKGATAGTHGPPTPPGHATPAASAAGHPPSLWPDHVAPGPKWEMVIDLNACTGCSGCLTACQVENNVPVVGRAEVAKGREMHWIRIDRYYRESVAGVGPEVMHQPMLCQHCDNAPCETVCPALATAHSTDGLNMQVYNRCVGTRYCANNCPYKVRRFNWFDYAHEDLMANLVLNPDVTVRSRGVMEKCSFCVQRIAVARRDAKAEDRPVADGEIRPACAQSCPAQAIVFGDANDPTSRVAQLKKDPRRYGVLTELGTRPAVHYLARIRHKKVT